MLISPTETGLEVQRLCYMLPMRFLHCVADANRVAAYCRVAAVLHLTARPLALSPTYSAWAASLPGQQARLPPVGLISALPSLIQDELFWLSAVSVHANSAGAQAAVHFCVLLCNARD